MNREDNIFINVSNSNFVYENLLRICEEMDATLPEIQSPKAIEDSTEIFRDVDIEQYLPFNDFDESNLTTEKNMNCAKDPNTHQDNAFINDSSLLPVTTDILSDNVIERLSSRNLEDTVCIISQTGNHSHRFTIENSEQKIHQKSQHGDMNQDTGILIHQDGLEKKSATIASNVSKEGEKYELSCTTSVSPSPLKSLHHPKMPDSSVENCQKEKNMQGSYIDQQSGKESDFASIALKCVSSEEVPDTKNKKCKLITYEESSSSHRINVTGSSKKHRKSKILNSTFPVSLVEDFPGSKTNSLHGNSYQNVHLTRKTRSASVDASNSANVSVKVQTKYVDESRYSPYSGTQSETSSAKLTKLTRSSAKSGTIVKAHEPRSQCLYLTQEKSKNCTKGSTTGSTLIKSVRKGEQKFNFPFTRSVTEKTWKRQKKNTKSPTSCTSNKVCSSDKTDVRKKITPKYRISCRSTKSRPSSNSKNIR